MTKTLSPIADDTTTQVCLRFYDDLDKVVAEQGVTPSRPERIASFPYLRMTRFMASFSEQDLEGDALKQWLLHLAAAEQQARLIELASLAPSALAKLNADQGSDLIALIEDCAQKLVKNDLAYPERLALLREQVKPTSEYRLLNQGVPSAGAMRERGRHATAFIGRRHFDEATLLDNLFEPASKYRH